MILIPFNKPFQAGPEAEYMLDAVAKGHISGNGPYTGKCENWLESLLGSARALLVSSCTDALEMTAQLLNLEPGDEVIVPSFTFVSSANAFSQFGVKIVFADIRPDTLNLDETQVPQLITSRTKAIVAVHYGGVGCDLDALPVSSIPVIEDNAHGLFARRNGKSLGTFGKASTFSFHETKNLTCGEGGALVLNDEDWVERAEIIRDKGTNRKKMMMGLTDKYTWVDRGSSHVLSDLAAAYLYGQMEFSACIQDRRKNIWNRYQQKLSAWAASHGIGLPWIPENCDQSFHLFYLLMPTADLRNALLLFLRKRGILAVFHYLPLHESPHGMRVGAAPLGCPVATDISQRIVRLPFFTGITEQEQDFVIKSIWEFFG